MPDNLPTSPPIPSALPDAWVDRLFSRFAAMYGKHWFDLWADVPMADVKAAWRTDLAAMCGDQIRRALDHCRGHSQFPPTLPEFVGLCRSFAIREIRPALPAPRGEIPPAIRTEIARLLDTQRKREPTDWAREVLRMDAEGAYPSEHGVRLAKDALGVA